jgi:hypothetical protein
MSLKNLAAMLRALARQLRPPGVDRDLGRARPEAFTPDLPGSLQNLASVRSEVGQCEPAPTASDGKDLLGKR